MGRKQDRENIVREITNAAILYKKHLVGKRFLYIFDDRYIEVIYKVDNFRHLTGVGTAISSHSFYEKAVKGKLQAGQIYFGPTHPMSFAARRLSQSVSCSSATTTYKHSSKSVEKSKFFAPEAPPKLSAKFCRCSEERAGRRAAV